MKHTLIPSLMAVTLLFGGTMPAFANHDKSPAERQAKIDEKFAKMDKNGDGMISDDEFEDKTEEKFTAIDTNGDDKISKEEMSTYKKAKWDHKK